MGLKEIATKVIDNYSLKTVLTNYVIYGMLNPENYDTSIPYENLVYFQVLECERPIEEAGYQVGEPWAGNIKSAPILFVSSTLGYCKDEVCPRYIPNDSPDGYEIAYTDRIFQERLMTGNMTTEDVIRFCNTRFKKAPINGKGICVRVRDGIKAVSYWGAVRTNVEFLLPEDFKELLKKKFADTEGYVHELMKYVACTSVVPFKVVPSKSSKYRRWFEGGKTFEHCWNAFAEETIALSGAKIIVLVGDDVLKAFEGSSRFATRRLMMTEKSTIGKKGDQDILKLYELENRLIVSVGSNQGGMRNFSRYFVDGSQIIEALRARVEGLFRLPKKRLMRE